MAARFYRKIFSSWSKFRELLRRLGPGLIAGVSDDDPAGVLTYSQAGATFGLATIWMALITTPLMISIQEMCSRIGQVSHHGLLYAIRSNYNKAILYVVVLVSFPAIIFNIGADVSAVGAVSNLLFPQIPALLFSVIFTVVLGVTLVRYNYRKISSFMKWLCIGLFAYFFVPFLINVNWGSVLEHTFIPTIQFNSGFIPILVAILGTTISPYLFFWQAASEVEDSHHNKGRRLGIETIKKERFDVSIGMIFSNLAMFFIILTTGTVLFGAGIGNIKTVDQAALALRPLAGNASYLLFSFGIIGMALLAIPVLAEALSYMYGELRGHEISMDSKFHEARGFYGVLIVSLAIGLLINFTGISPVNMLIYSAVLYGLVAPALIALILHLSNSRKVMGRYTNGRLSNIFGIATFIVMGACAILFLYFQFI